jgi:mannose-6-phosphate isomerase-like protein (cupin superfamily)
MEPGIVFNASTLSPNQVVARGQGQCFNLIDSQPYAEAMTASEIQISGNSSPKGSDSNTTLIFVRSGSASLEIIGDTSADAKNSLTVEAGSAIQIKSGETFIWTNAVDLIALELRIPNTSGPYARKQSHTASNFTRSVVQGKNLKTDATSDRHFEVLFDASNGSADATMFVGFIPPSGAPAHYHLYDEICYILRGSGEFKSGEKIQSLSAGSTFAVVPRLLHSLVNTANEDLWVLGVFRPEGSPAAAYYPDGKPAPGYSESK